MMKTCCFLELLVLLVVSGCNDSPVSPSRLVPTDPSGDPGTSEPLACFTTDPDGGGITEGDVIVLDARCSTGTSANAAYEWDLGDGRTRMGPRISIRYPQAGDYTIELRLHDQGVVSISRKEIRVLARLTACFIFERIPFNGANYPCSYFFDASCSQGPIREYRWFFEGSPHFPDDDETATTTEPEIEHTWVRNTECLSFRPFERRVRLTVVTDDGRSDFIEHTVEIVQPLK